MPYYMDRHDLTGVTAADVAAVHLKDLEVQERYGVQFVNYWFDNELQHAFCLAQAPDKKAVETVHRESHGLLPRQIITEGFRRRRQGLRGYLATRVNIAPRA